MTEPRLLLKVEATAPTRAGLAAELRRVADEVADQEGFTASAGGDAHSWNRWEVGTAP